MQNTSLNIETGHQLLMSNNKETHKYKLTKSINFSKVKNTLPPQTLQHFNKPLQTKTSPNSFLED